MKVRSEETRREMFHDWFPPHSSAEKLTDIILGSPYKPKLLFQQKFSSLGDNFLRQKRTSFFSPHWCTTWHALMSWTLPMCFTFTAAVISVTVGRIFYKRCEQTHFAELQLYFLWCMCLHLRKDGVQFQFLCDAIKPLKAFINCIMHVL